jgi:hypothetical protein
MWPAADGAPCTWPPTGPGSRLSAHVEPETGIQVREYPAESRIVLRLGEWDESLDVYVGAPELARLIDALNAAYVRVARRPYEDEPISVTGAA